MLVALRAALRILALLVVVHGVLFAAAASLVAARGSIGRAGADELYVFVLILPALALAAPLSRLLWWLGLMNAPGWFAWPKPTGVALVYITWVLASLGASYVVGAIAARRARTRAMEAPPT